MCLFATPPLCKVCTATYVYTRHVHDLVQSHSFAFLSIFAIDQFYLAVYWCKKVMKCFAKLWNPD